MRFGVAVQGHLQCCSTIKHGQCRSPAGHSTQIATCPAGLRKMPGTSGVSRPHLVCFALCCSHHQPPSKPFQAERPSKAAFYHCRYCCRWKVLGDFSSEQLLWADAVLPGRGRASRDGRGHRADPVCRSCAHFALSLENTSTALEEGQRSVSREVRYAPWASLEILGHPAIRRRFEGAMSLVSELL